MPRTRDEREAAAVILDVFHFSFTVDSIERSIDWYTRVLGLELVHRQRGESAYLRTFTGYPEAVLDVAMFKLPHVAPRCSTHVLELVEYVAPSAEDELSLRTVNVGVAHLALMVDDVHERYRRMVDLGVEFVSPPVQITEGANAGGFTCYLHDPDGITLELLQPSPARLEAIAAQQAERRSPDAPELTGGRT
jgi:catechol 2,3-dioxygenase-like lactoylglutathione lyase family enzyme